MENAINPFNLVKSSQRNMEEYLISTRTTKVKQGYCLEEKMAEF